MSEKLEMYKQKLTEAQRTNGDWQTPYNELMKTLYEEPILFFALSKKDFNAETETSIPLVSTKDFGGAPSLYVFSDVSIASSWMSHYKYTTDDMRFGLIGAAKKEDFNYKSVFQIAGALNIPMIMLDEGGSYVGIGLQDFVKANNINLENIEVPMTKEEAEAMLANNEEPKIRFAPFNAIPLAK